MMDLAKALQSAAATGVCLLLGSMPLRGHAAEAEQASAFVALKFQGACDSQNNRLWLSNTHTFKTISVTVRWKAAGGKDLLEQFYTAPNTIKEIGCAAESEITEVAFADF
jgi:hypothetical protein